MATPWAVETSLDVEWAHAIAPKATLVLVLANSASNADLMAAVNTARRYAGVSVVSMSWGGNESSTDPSYNSYFTTPSGHTGVTFLAASGDSGTYGSYSTRTVGYPAASPNVVAVGGTTLNVDSSGNYLSESGWGNGTSSYSLGGSGGGISQYETQPSYQHGVVTQSSTFRALPDVSFLADPNTGAAVIDSYDFGNTTPVAIGGTSLATPMWAGVIALADQGRVLAGLGTLDGATQTLPKLYALPSSDFHDITTGNNGYAAGPGFDLVTGRGTPIVNKLVPDLVGTPAPVSGVPYIGSFAVSPTSVVSGANVTLTAANVAETGGTVSAVKFYRESNGQSGLQIGSDTLIGTGVANGTTWTISTSTAGLGGGPFTYYAVATDTASVSSAVAQAALTIITPTFSSFTVNPSTVTAGTPVTLSANVSETGGTVSTVAFYAESNGTAGQQSTDTLLGNGVKSGSTWTLSTTTSGMAAGSYTYYAVATDAAGLTTTASVPLTISLPASSNDNFANGAFLTGTVIATTGSTVNATKEAGEPNHAGNAGGHSIWYTWTAPTSGLVSVNTHGSSFDTLLAVYKGNSVSALTLVAANDDTSNFDRTSAVSFNAVAGTTYHIAVDGYNGAQGQRRVERAGNGAPVQRQFGQRRGVDGQCLDRQQRQRHARNRRAHPGGQCGRSLRVGQLDGAHQRRGKSRHRRQQLRHDVGRLHRQYGLGADTGGDQRRRVDCRHDQCPLLQRRGGHHLSHPHRRLQRGPGQYCVDVVVTGAAIGNPWSDRRRCRRCSLCRRSAN